MEEIRTQKKKRLFNKKVEDIKRCKTKLIIGKITFSVGDFIEVLAQGRNIE